MDRKKEAKRLMKFARRVLDRKSIKKLKKVGAEDRIEIIKYAMKTRLEREYSYMREDAQKIKEDGKDTFFIDAKLNLLGSKIRLFNTTHHKADFASMANIFKETEREIKNV